MKKILAHERVCSNCGDTFLIQEGWKFKRSKSGKVHVFCTWGCMKAWDLENRKHPARDRREMMIDMIREGLTNGEIMVRLGYSYEEIDRCRERMIRDDKEFSEKNNNRTEGENSECKTGGEGRSETDRTARGFQPAGDGGQQSV